MTWVERWVGGRFGPARLLPLLVGPGYLLLVQQAAPTWADWMIVCASAALFLAGGVWPLAVVVGESLLIVAAHQWADATPVAVKVLASIALFELAVRRPLRQSLLGTAVLTAAYFAVYRYGGDIVTDVLAVTYRVITVGGAPVLLGAYLRSSAQAVEQAQARAEDAEERRKLAARSARMSERTEIARELHDLVAHNVASMALRAGVARAVVPDLDARVSDVLDDVHNSATTTLADLRKLVSVLRDPAAVPDDAGSVLVEPGELPAAVAVVLDRSRQAGLAVRSQVGPGIATLDSVRGLAVLRLVQEGLTNVSKHAGVGATADIRADVVDAAVVVDITDDGGASAAAGSVPSGEPGYGLIGLRERVDLVGGTLSAGPHGRGWRIRATLPIQAEDEITAAPAVVAKR